MVEIKVIPTNEESVKSSVLSILKEYKDHENFSQNGVSILMEEISNKIINIGVDMTKFGEYIDNIIIKEAEKAGYKPYIPK